MMALSFHLVCKGGRAGGMQDEGDRPSPSSNGHRRHNIKVRIKWRLGYHSPLQPLWYQDISHTIDICQQRLLPFLLGSVHRCGPF